MRESGGERQTDNNRGTGRKSIFSRNTRNQGKKRRELEEKR